MATKKTKKRPQAAAKGKDVQSGAPRAKRRQAASQPGKPGTAAPTAHPPFVVGKWKGLDNYQCLLCAYATVDYDRAVEHYNKAHVPQPPAARIIDTGIVSADGAPITREAPAKEA